MRAISFSQQADSATVGTGSFGLAVVGTGVKVATDQQKGVWDRGSRPLRDGDAFSTGWVQRNGGRPEAHRRSSGDCGQCPSGGRDVAFLLSSEMARWLSFRDIDAW